MLSEYHYFDPASKILLMGDGQRLNRFYLKQDIILPFAIETLSGFISRSYSYGTREVNIPSDDGRTIYRFSEGGSHLATIDSMTGVTLNRFVHNSRGFLTDIYDVDNNNTHIDRDAGDEIVAIVGPYGTRTSFSMDEDGRLATVRDENGSEYRFGYSMGILTSFTNPRGMTNTYEYDVRGDLIRATDAYSNYKTVDNMPSADLTRLSSMYTNYWTQGVAFTSPMGRRTLYLTSAEDSMDLTFANIYPDGSGFKNIVRLDPSYFLPWGETNTDFNGEEKVIEFAADPRFEYIRLPVKETNSRSRNISGITQYNRKIDLSDSSDPLSVSTFTDSIYLDGIGEYKETYNKRENSITYETPSGRTAIETLNAQGHVISAQTYMLEKVYYTYGSDGLLLHQQQGDRLYSFAYQKGLISGITDPMSNRWEFAYDAVGRLINSSLPNGYKVSYAYDENGNVKSITLPNDHSQIYAYDNRDLPRINTEPSISGVNASFNWLTSYDADKSLVLVTSPDSQQVSYNYDPVSGQLSSVEALGLLYQYLCCGAIPVA